MKWGEPGAGQFTLANASDTWNFKQGETYAFTTTGVRRVAGWFGLRWRARQWLIHKTRWWRPRMVCVAIDREQGIVSMALERWSWRRWRWEHR